VSAHDKFTFELSRSCIGYLQDGLEPEVRQLFVYLFPIPEM